MWKQNVWRFDTGIFQRSTVVIHNTLHCLRLLCIIAESITRTVNDYDPVFFSQTAHEALHSDTVIKYAFAR